MAAGTGLDEIRPMASRWRRRRMCILVADTSAPAALREISGSGAFVEVHLRPPLGAAVKLYHPEAGTIAAKVIACESDGVRLAFDRSEGAVAFALAAIGSDMSGPG